MNNKNISSKAFQIGLVTVFVLCLLYWGLNFLKGENIFEQNDLYYTRLKHTSGLTRTSAVTLNGYQVGRIKDLTFDYKNSQQAVAVLALNPDLKVPSTTTLKVQANVLGGATLILQFPEEDKHTIYLAPGDTLATFNGDNLLEVIEEKMVPQVASSLSKLDALLTHINTILGSSQLSAVMNNVSSTTENINKASQNLEHLISRQLPALINDLRTTSKDISSFTQEIDPQHNIPKILDDLALSIKNIKEITQQLQDKESSIGLLLNDSTLYNSLVNTTTAADALVKDIKANPKRYINVSLF